MAAPANSRPAERLHKVLARAGLGSRRQMEVWISDGRVSVDGKLATLGNSVSVGQLVRLDGKLLPGEQLFPQAARIIAFNKPVGMICTRNDEGGRPTVFEALPPPKQGRWVGVGRLDINSSGLILFTTDGELANQLMHPSSQILREYAARVMGPMRPGSLERLVRGVKLEDGPARFESIKPAGGEGSNQWYNVTLREGRNREVRRLFETQGVTVSRLIRIGFGPIRLPRQYRTGQYWELTPPEVAALLKGLGATVTGGGSG